jgi:hypothetical protein
MMFDPILEFMNGFSAKIGSILHLYPGTSCLATIGLSLWDKNHSPIEPPRVKSALMD